MCGVIGYFPRNPEPEAGLAFTRLFEESTIRGLHAFGLARAIPGSGLEVCKSFDLTDLQCRFNPLYPTISHARYALSGDYHEPENNQPLTLPTQQVALVFNGVIDMSTKEEMEARWGVRLSTYNDGEIFLRLLDKNGGDMEWAGEWVGRLSGSFAGLVLSGDGRIFALRNERRPLWAAQAHGASWVASTRDIFIRAGFLNPQALPVNVVWRFER